MSLFLKRIKLSFGINASKRLLRPPLGARTYNELPFQDIPQISQAQIKQELKNHNVSFQEGFTCFITQCPTCPKVTKTARQCIYINKATGVFMCSQCKFNGQWSYLEAKFKQKRRTKNQEELDSITKETAKRTTYLEQIRDSTEPLKGDNERTSDIMKKFKLPMVSSATLEALDIRYEEKEHCLYFPLENAESTIVGYRRLKARLQEDVILPDDSSGGLLTGKSGKSGKDNAILVQNVADFLVLLDAKVGGNVVCLPSGSNNLPLNILPSLERFRKLVLWVGDDAQSWGAAWLYARKLGEKRCFFVRAGGKRLLPHVDPNQDFKAIINSAYPIWHKSIVTFSSFREGVLSDLQNIEKDEGVKWTRFPKLNEFLKGHRRGELTVVTGPTGSGKTTFISEYSLDLAMQGVNTLWGSFEIRNSRLARTMLQQLAGFPLSEQLDKFDFWADQFEKLPIYFMAFHGQQTIKLVIEAIEHATYVHDIGHVIIDNLQFMMGISEEKNHMDRFFRQDTIVAAFRTFASDRHCHVTLVVHPRKEKIEDDLTVSSIFGGVKATQEADNVMIIQDKRSSLKTLKGNNFLQIAKNRYSGDLGVMPLRFDKTSLSFMEKPKKKKTSEEQGKNANKPAEIYLQEGARPANADTQFGP